MISEFPLFVFTTVGGLAAGAYAMNAVFPIEKKGRAFALKLAGLLLLAVGGIALMLHLGHPERALNAFVNPPAGITLEAYAAILFGVVLVVDVVLAKVKGGAPRALEYVGAVFGVLLALAMGIAYTQLVAIFAWTNWATVPLFLMGALSMGAPLMALFDIERASSGAYRVAVIVIQILAAFSCVTVGIHFNSLGLGIAPFAAAAVLEIVSVVGAALAADTKRASWAMTLCWIAALAAIVIARYAFYAAY